MRRVRIIDEPGNIYAYAAIDRATEPLTRSERHIASFNLENP